MGWWGLLFIPKKDICLADTGYGNAALGGTKPGTRAAALTVATFDKLMTSYSVLADYNDNIKIAIFISHLAAFISGSADL